MPRWRKHPHLAVYLTLSHTPAVRHGQTLDYEGLRAECASVVGRRHRRELGEALGVTGPAISQAVTKAGAQYANLQRRIIAFLTDYDVREERPAPTFIVERRKGEA